MEPSTHLATPHGVSREGGTLNASRNSAWGFARLTVLGSGSSPPAGALSRTATAKVRLRRESRETSAARRPIGSSPHLSRESDRSAANAVWLARQRPQCPNRGSGQTAAAAANLARSGKTCISGLFKIGTPHHAKEVLTVCCPLHLTPRQYIFSL